MSHKIFTGKRSHKIADRPHIAEDIERIASKNAVKALANIHKELGICKETLNYWIRHNQDIIKAYEKGMLAWWDHICKVMVDSYAEGMSDHEVAKRIGISAETFSQWHKHGVNKQFCDAYKLGRTLCRAWWDQKGRENLVAKNFNASVYIWSMKMRFGLFDDLLIPDFQKEKTGDVNTETEVQSIEVRLKKIITHEIKGTKEEDEPRSLEGPGEKEDSGESESSDMG